MIIIDNNNSESIFLIDGIKLEYLEKNIKLYNINKSDLYITPLVKCARKPTVKSLKECRDWIRKEIDILNPNIVIMIASNFNSAINLNSTKDIIWYNVSLAKLSSSTAEDKKYTEVIFRKIKEYCD